jgi:SprT protein
MTELQAKAIKRIKDVYAKAEDIYGIPLTFPIVSFRLKGRRAGYVMPAYNRLALNNALLHDHGDNFVNDTPGHEAAHLIAYAVYGYKIEPHGKEWKKVMIEACGQSPTRCHTYEVKTNHEYICKCDKIIYLSTTKHNRVLTCRSKYICNTCNTELRWKKLYEKAAIFSPVAQAS